MLSTVQGPQTTRTEQKCSPWHTSTCKSQRIQHREEVYVITACYWIYTVSWSGTKNGAIHAPAVWGQAMDVPLL